MILPVALYRVLPKKTLVFELTVLENQKELEAALWRALGAALLGSEVAWKSFENISCSRTSKRAEQARFQKTEFPHFFFHQKTKGVLVSLTVAGKKTPIAEMKFSRLPMANVLIAMLVLEPTHT